MRVPKNVLSEVFKLEDKILNMIDEINNNDLIDTEEVLNKEYFRLPLYELSVKDLSLYKQLIFEIIDENFDRIKRIYYKIGNRSYLPKDIKKWLDKNWDIDNDNY